MKKKIWKVGSHHLPSCYALKSCCPTSWELLWPVHRALYIVKVTFFCFRGILPNIPRGGVNAVQYPPYFQRALFNKCLYQRKFYIVCCFKTYYTLWPRELIIILKDLIILFSYDKILTILRNKSYMLLSLFKALQRGVFYKTWKISSIIFEL